MNPKEQIESLRHWSRHHYKAIRVDTGDAFKAAADSLESLQADNEKLRQTLLRIASISGGLHPHYGPPAEERLHDINEIAAPFIAK